MPIEEMKNKVIEAYGFEDFNTCYFFIVCASGVSESFIRATFNNIMEGV